MALHLLRKTAKDEAKDALTRHLDVLEKVNEFCFRKNEAKEGFLYLSATPIIYSAWEGYFRLSCSICLRRICYRGRNAGKYPKGYTALWLQKEKFFDGFLTKLFNTMTLGKDVSKFGAGKFNALADFGDEIKAWLSSPLNHSLDFDTLVMTYSNVNSDVAKLNAAIIGLDISAVDFSRLNELVGRRNDISHGGLITFPNETEIAALLAYAELLMKDFDKAVIKWLSEN